MFTLYLTCDNVQMMNEEFVGPDMLRDFGLLDASVMRPQASAHGEDAYPTLTRRRRRFCTLWRVTIRSLTGISAPPGQLPPSSIKSTATDCWFQTTPLSPW